jgi:hypothetical protein
MHFYIKLIKVIIYVHLNNMTIVFWTVHRAIFSGSLVQIRENSNFQIMWGENHHM